LLQGNWVTKRRRRYVVSVPVRVPNEIHEEVNAAANLLGCTPGELLQRSWEAYSASPKFREEFEFAQKALQVGDIKILAERYRESRQQRAAGRTAAIAGARVG
jgi:hypothetical protein